MRIAYLTSRFPKLSETFISNEIIEVGRHGLDVDIYAFVDEGGGVVHPEAAVLRARTNYPRWDRVFLDQFYWLAHHPRRYGSTVWRALAGNVRSPSFFVRALPTVPIAASFARSMAAREVNHVHAHWATHSGLAAYVIGRLTGIPYSITAHAHDITVDRTMLREKIEASKAVVTISDHNKAYLGSLYGEELAQKVVVVRCGVDRHRFEASTATATVEDPAPTHTIVTVASLEARKGHTILLQACRALLDDGIDIRCLFVGDGEHRTAIEHEIVRLHLSDRVVLAGACDSNGVRAALDRADLFVMPSITLANGKGEGIPVALMEAMAAGLPVVATDQAGIPELVLDRQTGLLVPEGSASRLAAAIAELLASPELRCRLGRAGRRHVKDHFDLAANVDALVQVFVS